jgi:hypothetical protein
MNIHQQERTDIINKIRATDYNLEHLDGYIDQLLESSMSKWCDEEDDQQLTEDFGEIAYGIMRVWFMCHKLDKYLSKETQPPQP